MSKPKLSRNMNRKLFHFRELSKNLKENKASSRNNCRKLKKK